MKRAFIFLVIAMFANFSHGTEWSKLALSNNGDTVFIDLQSIAELRPTEWKAWAKFDSVTSAKKPIYSKYLALYEANCQKQTMRITSVTLYGKNGELLESKSDQFTNFEPITPESIGSVIFEKICHFYDLNVDLENKKVQKLLKGFDEWKKSHPGQ